MPIPDPYLPTQQDTSLWWWNGRPCRIVQRFNYGGKVRVMIDFGGGQKRQVDLCELSDRNQWNVPDNFREVLEILRNLLVKLNADPLAGQYNADELISKLQELSDAIVGLQQQLSTVQWGNIQGNIISQADLQTMLDQRITEAEFDTLWQQAMQRYLHSRYHLSQPIPPFMG